MVQRRNAALSYIERGWTVLALYGVDERGICTCQDGERCGPNTGKHPIGGQWRTRGLSTAADLALLPRDANIGILTGLASKLWALDLDPRNGGDASLKALEEEFGALPETYLVRTGSGGLHYLFELPDDFTPGASNMRLPAGLECKGEGRQIVAPPSVSGFGPYEVLRGGPVLPAPAWLLDLIRPRIPVQRDDAPAWNAPSGSYQLSLIHIS